MVMNAIHQRMLLASLSMALTMVATKQASAQGTMVRPKPESATTDSSGNLKKDDSAIARGATVRGVLVLPDGSALPELVSIYVNCDGVRTFAAFADSKGAFAFNPEILTQAAKPTSCLIIAVQEGYYSEAKTLTIANLKSDEKLGKLLLQPLTSNPSGLGSTTNEQAGKAAKRNYEKALSQAAKGDLSGAIASLQKVTSDAADYSSAWLALGILQQSRGDRTGAQESFLASLGADPKFALPLIQLAALKAAKGDWRATLDYSQRAIELNPQSFPNAYALNAMANLNLQNIDAAEMSVREGLKLDVRHQYPELEYSLGNVLFSKNEPDEAAKHMRLYLSQAPNGPNAAIARDELAQIQSEAGGKRKSAASLRDQPDQPNPTTPLHTMPLPPAAAGPGTGLLQDRNAPLLVRTPDHTCLESVSRAQIDPRGRTHEPELFRVEVAVSGDKEIYGSVDGKRFSNGRLADMLGSTFSTTGLFGSIARGVIAANNVKVEFAGEETLHGEPVYRYTFRGLPNEVGWSLQYGKESGQAREGGWFLVDRSNLVLRRVVVQAVEIPPNLKLKTLDAIIDYEPVTIADRRVLLPRMAQVRVEEGSGTKRVSQMYFHHCRAFAAESTLSFDAGNSQADRNQASGKKPDLPPDLDVVVSLGSPISAASAGATDFLGASVAEPVFSKGREIIAKGANVEGHVLPRRGENGVVIELDRVQTRTGWAPFYARMVALPSTAQNGAESPAPSIAGDRTPLADPEIPGVAKIMFAGGSTGLAIGTRMTWRTESAELAPSGSRPPQLKTSVGMN
jgi:tetratricopeptide (TPR) repeat protein